MAGQNTENGQDGLSQKIEIGNVPSEGDDLRAGGLLFDGHGGDGGGWNEKTMIGKRVGNHEIFRQGRPCRDAPAVEKEGHLPRYAGTGTRPDKSHYRTQRR